MRKFLYIVLIFTVQLISGMLPLLGQPYLHEPTIWKEYYQYYSSSFIIHTQDYTIELKGDTLIDDKIYFKTLKTGTKTDNYPYGPSFEYPIYEYTFPIREEGQKFYIYNQDLQQEILLHDFDLSVGDTAVSHSSCINKTVTWIDSVFIGNIPRKRFHFDSSHDFVKLIEGIGSSRGLFFPVCNGLEIHAHLECFIQDQSYLELYSGHSGFDCSSLVATENNRDEDFNIYPNPFTGQLNIQFPTSSLQPVSVSVFNLLGTIVYQSTLHLPESTQGIDLEYIPPGMYVLWIKTNYGESSFKVIKQ